MKFPHLFRTALERFGRGKSFKRNIRVGEHNAKIIVSPDAQLKYLKVGKVPFDEDLINIALTCLEPDDTVWDIGANIGVFSVAAATCAKTVVAFEADIWLASLIRRTAQLPENSELDIKVVPTALSEKNGVAQFQIAMRGRASNALSKAGGRSQMGGVREEVMVPTLDLDTIASEFSPPDFVKIDVEGAELMVVSGGKELFETVDPLVYIEVGKEVYSDIFQYFSEKEYLAFTDTGNPMSQNTEFCSNVFFAKESHLARIEKLRRQLA